MWDREREGEELRENISVVICGYTEERYGNIVDAVESVCKQTRPAAEIIVVIDHNPRLLQRVKERFPQIIVVENSDMRGTAGARNTGCSLVTSELIAYLDDDAIATPDWLEKLCAPFQDPLVLGVGGQLTPLWPEKKPDWFPEEFYWVFGCSYIGEMQQKASRIRNPIAANMAIRKDVFHSIGGFRNDTGRVGARPTGCEETELAIRARQQYPQGYFLFVPQAIVLHRVPLKRTKWKYFCTRCYDEGLSKAVVVKLVGGKDGLASERSYTYRTLPQGVLRGLADTFARHEVVGMVRASVIVVGLLFTAYGYIVGLSMIAMARNTSVVLRGFQTSTRG
jgi:GT2 family glycosyltransferase